MNERLIKKFIRHAPESVQADAIDFTNIIAKDGRISLRVTLDRLITDEEKSEMKRIKCFIGLDFVAYHKYAPEIRQSYFYVM
jgi:hypothetical protein